jgi:hypothetical protein
MYLIQEVGGEVELSWRSSLFFMQGKIKTENMGQVLKYLALSKLV